MIVRLALVLLCLSSTQVNLPLADSSLIEKLTIRFYFDELATRDAVRVEDHLVVLTSPGMLQRIRMDDRAVVHRRMPSADLVTLDSVSPTRVVAGSRDGRIFDVDSKTLALTTIGRVPFEPMWIGEKDGDLLVAGGTEEPGQLDQIWSYFLATVGSTTTIRLRDSPDTVFLDSKSRLWIASNHGEFGAKISRYDLASGNVKDFTEACSEARLPEEDESEAMGIAIEDGLGCENTRGFLEDGDTMLIYGGLWHLASSTSYVASIAPTDTLTMLAFHQGLTIWEPEEPPAGLSIPFFPASDLLPLGESGWAVVNHTGVFLFDTSFDSYRPLATSADGMRVVSAYVMQDDPIRLLISTENKGTLLADESGVLPQLSTTILEPRLDAIGTLEGRPLFKGWRQLWHRQSDHTWQSLDTDPEDPVVPPALVGYDEWDLADAMTLDEGTLLLSHLTLTLRRTANWSATTQQHTGVSLPTVDLPLSGLSPFLAADGEVWGTDDGQLLLRTRESDWIVHSPLPDAGLGFTLKPLACDATRCALWNDKDGALWIHIIEDGSSPGALERYPAVDETVCAIFDGQRLDAENTILLSETGLWEMNSAFEFAKLAPTVPDGAEHLAIDHLGRIWLGGEGLWVVDDAGEPRRIDTQLPWMDTKIRDLMPDPNSATSVLVSLQDKGVAQFNLRPNPSQHEQDQATSPVAPEAAP